MSLSCCHCTNEQGRRVGLSKQCVVQQNWHCDVKAVPTVTQISRKLQTINQSHWRAAREFLTFFDTIRFCRYLALLDERTKSKWKNKNERLLALLRRDRFGNALGDTTRHVLNLSDYVLSDTESFVLSHGLNFGVATQVSVQRRNLSPNLSHCGHSFYITVPVLLNNALL